MKQVLLMINLFLYVLLTASCHKMTTNAKDETGPTATLIGKWEEVREETYYNGELDQAVEKSDYYYVFMDSGYFQSLSGSGYYSEAGSYSVSKDILTIIINVIVLGDNIYKDNERTETCKIEKLTKNELVLSYEGMFFSPDPGSFVDKQYFKKVE